MISTTLFVWLSICYISNGGVGVLITLGVAVRIAVKQGLDMRVTVRVRDRGKGSV